MSVMRPEGFIGHVWEANRCPRCISVLGMVNVTRYLRRASLGPGAGSTRMVFLRHAQPPPSGSATPNPGLGAAGFDQGRVLLG
jgi:hypothetical protein